MPTFAMKEYEVERWADLQAWNSLESSHLCLELYRHRSGASQQQMDSSQFPVQGV